MDASGGATAFSPRGDKSLISDRREARGAGRSQLEEIVMSRRKAIAHRPSIASAAAIIWIAGIATAQAMSDGDGGPGGRRVDPRETSGPKGNAPACADGMVYDAKLNRCVKAERALPPATRPAG
jgi:hypothetical protein